MEEAARAADVVSPPLAGQLLGQMANAQIDDGGIKKAVITFEAALDKLAGTDLALSRAELHTSCGATYQEMSESAPRLMQQAINHYHQALALVTRESAPDVFAIANANLGLAYLMMPMNEASDQLRMGVAVQSMRDALEVFTPETHPDRWSSTQLNLANALIYLPSKHQPTTSPKPLTSTKVCWLTGTATPTPRGGPGCWPTRETPWPISATSTTPRSGC